MLRKYPGLAMAAGLALAIAIGLGAGWYDFSPIFSRAAWIVGSGIVAGNVLLLVFIVFAAAPIPVTFILRGLGVTSAVMLTVAVLACASPARRALRIQPTEALRHL